MQQKKTKKKQKKNWAKKPVDCICKFKTRTYI